MKESRCPSKSQKREEVQKDWITWIIQGEGRECGKKDEGGEIRDQSPEQAFYGMLRSAKLIKHGAH